MRIRTLALAVAAPVALVLAGPYVAAASTARPGVCPMSGVRGRVIGAVTGKGLTLGVDNTSSTPCELAGYPDLALLDGGGKVIGVATPDALGGDGGTFVPGPSVSPAPGQGPGPAPSQGAGPPPAPVTLPPGGRAWLWLRYVSNPDRGSRCSPVRALRVGVAHRHDSLTVPVSFAPCGEVGVTAFRPRP